MTRRVFLAGFGLAARAMPRSWEQPEFPDWPPEFVDRLLTNSPWARQITVSFTFQPHPQPFSYSQIGLPPGIGLPSGVPGTGWPRIPSKGGDHGGVAAGVRTEIYLVIRWSSALPIRQALALAQFGRDGLGNPKAVELLQGSQPEYVIEIAGFPATIATSTELKQELSETSTLVAKDRRSVAASSVRVPDYGMHLMATLRFPRFENMEPTDGNVQLSAAAGPIKIDQQFKLKAMLYHGRLEL